MNIHNEEPLFPSFEALRKAHNDLLKQHREEKDTPEILQAIKDFIRRGKGAGAFLDSEDDRMAAQNLLDYWATRLYRLDETSPDATLDDFAPALAPDLADELCPYLGLDAFNEAQGNLLFGRQRLIESMLSRIEAPQTASRRTIDNLLSRLEDRTADKGTTNPRLLIVTGPSGSGKSSLVRAGLIPALKTAEENRPEATDQPRRYFDPILPGSAPLQSLARMLQANSIDATTESFLQSPHSLAQFVANNINGNVLVMVDQFEEVFTLCDNQRVRQAFANNLLQLVKDTRFQHIVILTLRTDFESQMARLPEFMPYFENAVVRMTPLNANELREAIEGPARLIGLKFGDGVVDALLNDILGEPAALPLLQFTLLKLWENRDHNRVTWETYQKLGGGRQALAHSADEFYNSLITEEQITARRILLRLVRPTEGLEVTSYRMKRSSLYFKAEAADRIDRVLTKLVKARLLRLTYGSTPADDQIEVAHEALVRNWPTLIGWLNEERLLLRERQRLTAAAEHWRSLEYDPGALLRGVSLKEAEQYEDLNELEASFVHASQTALEKEEAAKEAARQRELMDARRITQETEARRQAEEQRAQEAEMAAARLAKRNQLISAVGAAAFILALIAGFLFALASSAQREADQQRMVAIDQGSTAVAEAQMRATAQAQAEIQKDYAEAASTEAVAQKGYAEAASTEAVAQKGYAEAASTQAVGLQKTAEAASTEAVSQSQIAATQEALAREQSLIALQQSQIANSRQWAARALSYVNTKADLLLLFSVEAYRASHTHEAFNTLLLALQRTLRRTSIQSSVMVYGSTGGVTSITFNLEGNVLAMGNANGTITLRDIKKQNLLDAPHFSHSEKVLILTYSPDGNHIASGSADGSAVIYNIKRQNFHTIVTGDSNIWRVAFSPDGDKLALTRSNGWVSIWDVRSWDDSRITSLTNFTIHTGPVNGVAWSPYGTRLVSGGSDRVLRIWEAETGEFVHLLNGHTGSINCVDWSPDGKIIASGSDDMSVILWDAAYGREITRLTGHTGYINDVRFSPDGKLLASSSRDGSIILWDVNLMKPLDQLKGPIPVVESIAFSPDGSLLAANSGDSVNLWKISTQEPLGQFVFGQGKKTSVVVKNDGQVLALGVQNSVPMVWNMTTNHLDQIFAKDKYTSFVLNPYDDGKTLVTGDEGGKIIIWDVSSKEALNTIETETRTAIDAAVLNPAGDVLAWSYCQTYTGGRCTESAIQLWDIKAGQASGAPLIIEDTGLVTSLVFHPKGKFLASGSANGNIFIWDLLTGQQVGLPLTEHSRPVISLTFSPDGAFLASSSPDGMTILWDMNTRQATGDPFSMPGVSSAGFSQAGNLVLATGATDGSVILWDVSADSWLQRACEAAQRNFTQREWSQFFPDRPYQKTCEQWPDGE